MLLELMRGPAGDGGRGPAGDGGILSTGNMLKVLLKLLLRASELFLSLCSTELRLLDLRFGRPCPASFATEGRVGEPMDNDAALDVRSSISVMSTNAKSLLSRSPLPFFDPALIRGSSDRIRLLDLL